MPNDRPAILDTPQHRRALREAALRYAERGFRVLPLWWPVGEDCACGNAACGNAGKHPYAQLVPRGWHDASSDAARIEHWWRQVPDANVGIVMGENGTIAIDIDPRNGGHITWEAIEQEHGTITDTPIAETGSGGQHILVSLTADQVASCVSTLGPGIDIKASGYIVAEPSLHASGRKYAWRDETDLLQGYVPAAAPPWLQRILTRPAVSSVGLPAAGIPADQRTVGEVRQALSHLNPDDYHEWVHNGLALHATGWGSTAYEIWDEWSQRSSKYENGETQAKWHGFGRNAERPAITIKSIFARAQARGWINPLAGFVPAQAAPKADLFPVEFLDELDQRAPVRWLVRRWLQTRGISVIYGKPGSGKSFFALDIGMTVAWHAANNAVRWNGNRVKGGGVLYVAAEGNMQLRVRAWKRQNGVTGDLPIGFVHAPIDLASATSNDVERLVRTIRAHAERLMPLRLIQIDTLARAMAGADENSGEAMGLLIEHAERLADELECNVMLVHHVGKDEARGMRGHSSLLGALTTSIEISRDGESVTRNATVGKQKDGEDGFSLAFNLVTVDLGASTDPDADDGERDTSCVVIPEVSAAGIVTNKASQRAELLSSVIGSHCSLMAARTAFYAACGIDDADQRRVAWNRALNELKRANRVAIDGGELWIVLPGETSK